MGHRKVPLKTYMRNVMRIPPYLTDKKKRVGPAETQMDRNEDDDDDDEYEDVDDDENADEDNQGK